LLLFSFAVTATEFFIFFAHYGKVLDSFIVYDRSTGKPRGFGFVTFEDPAVCQTLLQMQSANASKSSSFDEDLDEQSDSMSSPSRLMMRGRLIEMKIAQPRETESKKWQPMQQPTYQLPNPHYSLYHQPYWGNENGMYDYVTKYPATLPQHNYGLYDGAPMTPIPPSSPMMTPATPAQAVLDMAHHMLFYAQLLATPSLSTANYEPMLAPFCESPRYEIPLDYHQHRRHEPSLPSTQESSATTTPLPELPDVLVSPSKRPKDAFQIGGATFYPDLPSSPPNSPKDTISSQKKRIVTSL
jgi:RNA recognition motif. (a.k.a. RRM, RBD, or RNP domain)